MVPRSEKLELPGGADAEAVRAFVARALKGHAVQEAAARVGAALAADTARWFDGRPCEATVETGSGGDPAAVRVSVTARLPICPAEPDPAAAR